MLDRMQKSYYIIEIYSRERHVGAIGFDRGRRDGNGVPRSRYLVKPLGI